MNAVPRSLNFTLDDWAYLEAAAEAFGARSVRNYLLYLVHAEVLHACPRTLTRTGCVHHARSDHQ